MIDRALSRFFRRGRHGDPRAPQVWSGIYRSFDELPHSDTPYASHEAMKAAEALLRETEADPMPREAMIDHQVLALAVRLMHAPEVAILDFGGGVGQSYAALRRMLSPEIRLRYRIVDLEDVASRGQELWKQHGEVDFSSDFEQPEFPASIVFAKGFIQYIADVPALLGSWFARSPRFVLLEKLSVVTSPAYVTTQRNVYGKDLPYWMFNIGDLDEVARASGYTIVLQRRLERVYDQSDFPPDLRMGRATSLLFERAT